MATYTDVAERFLAFESREFGVGATEAEIAAAERLLGLPIAGGYRNFLEQFGWGGVLHIELFGLGVDVPQHLNLVALTQSERREMNPRLRVELLPIMTDGAGNLHCLATNTTPEPSVVFWDHTAGPDQQPDVEALDFSAWLAERLDELEG